jgi:hypothetical protein
MKFDVAENLPIENSERSSKRTNIMSPAQIKWVPCLRLKQFINENTNLEVKLSAALSILSGNNK